MTLAMVLVVLVVVVVAVLAVAAFRRRHVASARGDEGEQRVARLRSQPCLTRSGTTVHVDAQIRFLVVDPSAPRTMRDPADGVEQVAHNVARTVLAEYSDEEAPLASGRIESAMRDRFRRRAASQLGIRIVNVAVTAITAEPGRTPVTEVREDPLP